MKNVPQEEVTARKMSWPTVATGILVSALVMGGLLSVFYTPPVAAEEVVVVPTEVTVKAPLPALTVAEVVAENSDKVEETRAESFARMFDTESEAPTGDVIVITASDKPFVCNIFITGENGWSFDRLLDIAMKYGCMVTLDRTPASS